ncbi:hypothetical protein Y1Q_0013737 [Alligator mississippiensis]|uniref:Uncharacterized protein n=1 Tax=Alligator mississippiensis TaxID=8496 RepID=A0A151NVR2_ALLMI|nr:hypothetical protein Y1Q_0013737 [Alligator mississippiensis]
MDSSGRSRQHPGLVKPLSGAACGRGRQAEPNPDPHAPPPQSGEGRTGPGRAPFVASLTAAAARARGRVARSCRADRGIKAVIKKLAFK